jgi:hypothetical protein
MPSNAPALLFAALLLAAPCGLAQAQSGEATQSPTVAALLACREITVQDQRVECLEQQVAAFADALESGRVYVVEQETVREAERESFGFGRESLTRFATAIGLGESRSDAEAEANAISFEDGVTAETDASGRLSQLDGLAVTEVSRNRSGRLTVRLDNGQVWRQIDGTVVPTVRDRHFEAGLTASVETGALGSYFMRLSHSPRRFRAERIR